MPQSSMDWWVILGVIVAIAGVFFAWRQWRGSKFKNTSNIARDSDRVTQTGGEGVTRNQAENSRDVDQSG